jgi:hypothetical protein
MQMSRRIHQELSAMRRKLILNSCRAAPQPPQEYRRSNPIGVVARCNPPPAIDSAAGGHIPLSLITGDLLSLLANCI